MNQPITLRASAMPRVTQCPGSAFLPHIESTNPAAQLGTAAHIVAERIVRGEEPNVPQVATLYDVDADELQHLSYSAVALWREWGQHFPEPQTEVEFAPLSIADDASLTGHADVVSVPGDGTIRIADWKSGWKEGDYGAQLKTYAYLAWQRVHLFTDDGLIVGCTPNEIERVYVAILWLRDRSIEGQWFDVHTLKQWGHMLHLAVEAGREGTLRTGPQCTYRPVAQCPAIQSQALALRDDLPLEVTPENVATLYHFHNAASRRLEYLKNAIEQHIRSCGSVELSDGSWLDLVERRREKIELNPDAYRLLMSTFAPEELLPLLNVSKTQFENLIRSKAERGQKKAAVDKAMETLRECGAVSESVSFSVGIVKPKGEKG